MNNDFSSNVIPEDDRNRRNQHDDGAAKNRSAHHAYPSLDAALADVPDTDTFLLASERLNLRRSRLDELMTAQKELADEYHDMILDALDIYAENTDRADSISVYREAERLMLSQIAEAIARREKAIRELQASLDDDDTDLFAADGEPQPPAAPVDDPESVGF